MTQEAHTGEVAAPPRHGPYVILHAWFESTDDDLRIRVTALPDLAGPEVEVAVTTTVEEAVAKAHQWLDAAVSGRRSHKR